MRNYVFTRFILYKTIYDDGMGGIGDFFSAQSGGNDTELMSNVQKANASFEASLPPGVYTVTFEYPNEPITLYYLLDKTTILTMLQLNPTFFYNDAQLPAASQTFRCQPEMSPRKDGWKDQKGEEHKPPPSEGGGEPIPTGGFNYPVDFLTSLVLIYQKLLEVRQFGLASQLEVFIVKIVKKQAIDIKALHALLDRIKAFVG